MLVACLAERWSIDSYEGPEHPLQKRMRSVLAEFAGMLPGAIELATDNCAVPTFRIPLANAAQAFARLATGKEVSKRLGQASARVVRAMTRYPEMVGGHHSWDTVLMRATRGRIVCKGGADGFQGIGGASGGLGLAVRISDGNSAAIPPTVIAVMEHLGMLDADALRDLQAYRTIEIWNHLQELVGRIETSLRLEAPV
jgi:L-asparaginase II